MSLHREPDNLIGESDAFLQVIEHVSLAAPLHKPVLIIGERGTGKELIAQRLHYLSERWQQPYITLNCAALNENLLESELFGHDPGAFTGAQKRHQGRFERADGGTLFLDELANTSARVQEKLLRVIEYGEFERVGGLRPVQVDVRLLAATNEDLPALAASGQFRADLLDRLAFDVVTLPPLRERQEDIPILAEQFGINMARELGFSCFPGLSPAAKEQLGTYHWPGNVRELKNAIERSLYRHGQDDEPIPQLQLDPFASPWRPRCSGQVTGTASQALTNTSVTQHESDYELPSADTPVDLKELRQDFEKTVLRRALQHCRYNQKKTAAHLGLTYHQLRGYLKKYPLLEEAHDH